MLHKSAPNIVIANITRLHVLGNSAISHSLTHELTSS
jgi:hypothetical protein